MNDLGDVYFKFSLALIPNNHIKASERIFAILHASNICLKTVTLAKQDVFPMFDSLSDNKEFSGLRYLS